MSGLELDESLTWTTNILDVFQGEFGEWHLDIDYCRYSMHGKPQLAVGDRVRITITKEPKPDAQPVQPPL
jgi:hypothetical protein